MKASIPELTWVAWMFFYPRAAVPPPGFAALGMVLTAGNAPPPLTALRCVPAAWTCRPTQPPKLVWENGGSGGRPASVWVVNSLGTAHVTVGFDAPLPGDVLAGVGCPHVVYVSSTCRPRVVNVSSTFPPRVVNVSSTCRRFTCLCRPRVVPSLVFIHHHHFWRGA